ncbi:5-oxoprolinase subunit PxpB [Paenibacillus yanchengensis]|uniref:5-oxoprolinase subunit PxpB n=2 Tax=Paenibacillus yanchengensis TaxID=2035833 RepID=A0ABW4YFR1_9BACL
MKSYTIEPLGDSALLIRFGKQIAIEAHRQVMEAKQLLEQRPFHGLVEVVISYAAIAVHYEPIAVLQQQLPVGKQRDSTVFTIVAQIVEEILAEQRVSLGEEQCSSPVIEVPVCYGGSFGPDLAELAAACQLSVQEVIAIHSEPLYLIYMLGFAPGFPYLGGMDERITYKRRDQPRTLVAAGSVGIAGLQTGIYPTAMPGGWNIIGRTPLTLFDADHDPPAVLQAGKRIKFVPISEAEYDKWV